MSKPVRFIIEHVIATTYDENNKIIKRHVYDNFLIVRKKTEEDNIKKAAEDEVVELRSDKAYAEEQLDLQIQATLKLQKENKKLKDYYEKADQICDRVLKENREIRDRSLELEEENERLEVQYETLKLHDEEEIGMLNSRVAKLEDDNRLLEKRGSDLLKNLLDKNKKYKQQKNKVKFIIKDLLLVLDGKGGEDFRKEVLQSAEQFLKEIEK